MDLLGMELAGFARLHQCDCVVEFRSPVESAAKHLANEGPRQRVVSAISTVYVSQQLLPLFPGDAMQGNIVWPLPIELSVLD